MSIMKTAQSFLVILSLLLNSSCATRQLWEEKRYYDDTIKEYLVSDDGSKVIFLGKKYHYIFDDNSGAVKQLLKWGGRSKLVMNIYDFKALSENDVKLSVWISSAPQKELSNKNLPTLSKEEIDFLRKLGFLEGKTGSNNMLSKKIDLNGTRYLPKPNVNYEISSSLNKEYKVKVEYSNFFDKTVKVALTPITVAEDAIIIVTGTGLVITFGVVAGAISLPLYFVACVANPNNKCDKH